MKIKNLKLINILLVEDEKEIQKSFCEVLGYFFNKVYVASNGKEALEILEDKNISAIFTDYEMPIMNGYELTLEVRKTNKDIPITIISNHNDSDKLQKCIPLGLSGYLFKPMNYESIKQYLQEFSKTIEKLDNKIFELNDSILFNVNDKTLVIDNKEFRLTKLESEFLELMYTAKDKLVTYDMIFERMYYHNTSHNTIKNLVYRLKKKYNINNIENIRDIGYRLNLGQ